MKSNGTCGSRLILGALCVLAIAGWFQEPRRLGAQDGTADSREQVLAALKNAREEYLSRTFLADEKRMLTELFLAEQSKKTAEEAVRHAKSLLEKKIITAKQLEAAETTLESGGKRLEVAQEKLKSLRESKGPIMEQFERLEAAIRAGSAK
jgi:hypothetical protein